MRITRLRLQNVKRHAELELELAPGLTVIRGPNEAGKSTIQQAIELVLFRKPTSAAQELNGVRRWGAQQDPVVELQFEEDGAAGRLAKRFAGSKGTVELEYAGKTLTDPGAVEQQVMALTGLPSERFYRATASIHHHELTGLEQDEATLRDRLQQAISGADKGTRVARRKLQEAIRRYRTEGAKNPGYLKAARDDVDRLNEAVSQGEAALADLERDRTALVEARQKRTDAEDQLSQYRQALEASERALKLAERAEEATQRYTHYKRAEELNSEIVALEGAHPSGVPLADLRPAVERIRNQEYRLSEIRAEIAAEPDPSAYDAVISVPRWKVFAVLAAMLLGAALAALAGGLLLDQLVVGTGIAAALALLAVLLILIALRRRVRARAAEAQIVLQEIDISRRLRGRTDRTEQLREAERARDEAVAALGLPDLAAAEELLQMEIEHVAKIDNASAELRGLLGDEQPEQPFTVLRDRHAAEASEYRHALAGMGPIGSEPEQNHARFADAVEKAVAEREQALTAEAQAEARLEANKTDAEEVAARAEALAAAQERLASLERRLRIYDTVLGALDEAEQGTMKKAARFLEQSMAADVDLITGGRYRRLRVDEAKLAFSVYSPERGDWLEVREGLSQGTLDQLYLCARLGIVRQVTQPATPPLMLDDPFVTFDDERARRAVELLKRVAGEYQVILLSCSERYDELADKLIELPAPEARDEAADQAPAAEQSATGQRAAAREVTQARSRRWPAAEAPQQVAFDLAAEPPVPAGEGAPAEER